MTFRHKGEELKSLATAYEKALCCQQWAEEMRDAYYDGRITAKQGNNAAAGDRSIRGGDAFSREYGWKHDLTARDFVGLEQLYRGWATMYFAQATMEALVELTMVLAPQPGVANVPLQSRMD